MKRPPRWTGTGWKSIGHGVWIRPYQTSSNPDEVAGYHLGHHHPDGAWCMGSVPLRGSEFGGDEWDRPSTDPLTLHPSIKQSTAGVECIHGWIRDGRWVPA